jgi:hypothetical protein
MEAMCYFFVVISNMHLFFNISSNFLLSLGYEKDRGVGLVIFYERGERKGKRPFLPQDSRPKISPVGINLINPLWTYVIILYTEGFNANSDD